MAALPSQQGLLVQNIEHRTRFPAWATEDKVVQFLHNTMKPYEDTVEDIQHGLDYAFSSHEGKGGFVLLAKLNDQLSGALVMLNTGMRGYVPEHLLLFVSVAPEARRKGVGQALVERAIKECEGDVELHVEYYNPAKRLYERIGFTNKYADMRYVK